MALTPIDPKDFPEFRAIAKRRANLAILEEFLISGSPLSEVDLEGRSVGAVNSGLAIAAKGSGKPIKVFTRRGKVYLMRTDLDK